MNKSVEILLAAHGGPKAVANPVSDWPRTSDEVLASVSESVQSGHWGKYDGQYTQRLEETLRVFFACSEILLASSGTIAVELALRGVGVKSGDEVVLAGYDFPGNFRAIEAIGAVPVLVDVAQDSWVADAESVVAAVSEKTTAVLVSHLHGQLVDVPEIRERLGQHSDREILIVEDACQVPGAKLKSQRCGTMGDVGVLSFGGSKLLSAGRGGAVIGNRPELVQRARVFSNRGNDAFPLSQLQAAALIPQFDSLVEFSERRCVAAGELINASALKDCDLIEVGRYVAGSAWYKVPFLIDEKIDRELAIALLKAEGVPADIGFRGFAKRSSRRCRKVGELSHSIAAANRTILLHHPALLEAQQTREQIANGILKVMEYLRGQF